MDAFYDRSLSRPAVSWPLTAKNDSTEEATYIVLGNPHGGTTLIAGLLRIMGLFMGRQIDSWTQEDIAMRSQDLQQLISAVESRNAEFTKWGWKCPGSIQYLDSLKTSLRNPRFIAIFRDPYATSLRTIVSEKSDPIESFQEWLSGTQLQLDLVKRFAEPTLFISYEMALKRPNFLIDDLTRFIGIPELSDQLKSKLLRYVNPEGGYRNADENIDESTCPLPVINQRPSFLEPSNGDFQTLELVRPYGIKRHGKQWVLDLDDSHCFASDADIVKLPNRRTIRLKIRTNENQLVEPSLYLDIGYGLREEHRIRFGKLGSGIWDFEVEFPPTLGALRFDPDETSGTIDELIVSIL